jgi:CHAT domain-containing protein/Tfp pilus assembly protein PilF
MMNFQTTLKKISFFLFLFLSLHASSQGILELGDSVLFYNKTKNYEKAVPFAEKLLLQVKDKYGTDNKFYSGFLSLLSGLYVSNLQLDKAEQSLLELKKVNLKVYGNSNEEYVKGISLLAVVYHMTGHDEKTIPLLTEVMEYYKKSFGDTSYEYASSINKLSRVYEDLGELDKALPLSQRSLVLTATTRGMNSPEYATALTNLGVLMNNTGSPEKAEPMLLRALAIRKKVLGEEDPDFANSLNNLAVLYTALGQPYKAKDYYLEATTVYKKSKGLESMEFLTSLSNLAAAMEETGDYKGAEDTYLQALDIIEKKYALDWPLRKHLFNDLGLLYLSKNEYAKAEPMLKSSLDFEEGKNVQGKNYALALNNLAFLYNHTGRNKEAESLYIRSSEIIKTNLGEKHPDYAKTLNNLALFYIENKRYGESVPLLQQISSLTLESYLSLFSVLSESEKMQYADRNIFLENTNLSLLYRYPTASASFYRDCYNAELLMKSLLLTDSKNVLEALRSSVDTSIQQVYNKWQEDRKILARQYALSEKDRDPGLDKLEQETIDKEKELVRRSASFRDMRKGLNITLEDIRHKLAVDEAAIEFVNFRLICNGAADSIEYAAFLLRKNDSVPRFIPLFEEQQLLAITSKTGKTSRTAISLFYPGKKQTGYDQNAPGYKVYKLIWEPLEPYLKNIKTISYSPTGKLFSIAFHALPADSFTLLSEKYRLKQYLSIRQLALRKENEVGESPADIVLMGNPAFTMDSLQIVNAYKNPQPKKSAHPVKVPNKSGVPLWPALPGTEEEIKKIAALFRGKNLQVKLFSGVEASEKNLKSLDDHAPQVLNIATHGFFLSPETNTVDQPGLIRENVYRQTEYSLLKSGLILSGGNYSWMRKPPIEGVEDGIVTANEISRLNFTHTKLVVLSACETGLGDVRGTEGVFGLQRAFKLAGADKLILSLWKVPDKETSELMLNFYSSWLNGISIQDAFSLAQSSMRQKYPPFYWAAFVLVE